MYAEKASASLKEVVDGIQTIAGSARKMKEISIEQADSMDQVEQTSATSEELTAQATTLSGMVSVFKLRE